MALAVPPLGVPHTWWSAGIMQGHQHTGARGHQVLLRAVGVRTLPGPGWANPLQPPGHVRMGEGILQPDLGRQAESSGTCPLSPLFPCKPTVLLKQHLPKPGQDLQRCPSLSTGCLIPTGVFALCHGERPCSCRGEGSGGAVGCPQVWVRFFLTPKQGPKSCLQPQAGGCGSVPARLPHAACRRG